MACHQLIPGIPERGHLAGASFEISDFCEGDPSFDTIPATGVVTQIVTAAISTSVVTNTFFKAAIEVPIPTDPEVPWDE